MIAYMLTWTTYGSWLQGDERGWVKDGKILDPCSILEEINEDTMEKSAVELNAEQKSHALAGIIDKASQLGQKIYAAAVCHNHIHLIVGCIGIEIGRIISYYKHAIRLSLQDNGFSGKLWTRGYDTRFYDTIQEISEKIEYVLGHKEIGIVYQ